MPLGSSSEAPVISPGPSSRRKPRWWRRAGSGRNRRRGAGRRASTGDAPLFSVDPVSSLMRARPPAGSAPRRARMRPLRSYRFCCKTYTGMRPRPNFRPRPGHPAGRRCRRHPGGSGGGTQPSPRFTMISAGSAPGAAIGSKLRVLGERLDTKSRRTDPRRDRGHDGGQGRRNGRIGMLSGEDNELLTRVGPGTAMGATMRRYWIPALLAREVAAPDGPPVRVRLLGEDLVAFRDSEGRIGLLAEACPHRGASLYFGRNEAGGLRCVYHGWKFDVSGRCLEQMNEPPEHCFAHKVRITAYPTLELGGLIWAYLGPAGQMPPPPRFAWTQAPASHRHVSKVIQECNWLQALEGGLDTSHAPILHRLLKDDAGRGGIRPSNPYVRAGA